MANIIRKAAKRMHAALIGKKNEVTMCGQIDLEGLGDWLEHCENNYNKLGNALVDNLRYQLDHNKYGHEYNAVAIMKLLIDYLDDNFKGARIPQPEGDDDFDAVYPMVSLLKVFGYQGKPKL